MKLLLQDSALDRDKWLNLRKSYIGSSDIAVLCKMAHDDPNHQRNSLLELWAEKTGKVAPEPENAAMRLGHRMEPVIGAMFGDEHPEWEMVKCGAMYAHDTIPNISATPDFFTLKPKEPGAQYQEMGIVECKNTNYRSMPYWELEAPRRHQIQLQWQLGICGIEWGFVAGLVGGDAYNFKQYEFQFDKTTFDMCVELAQDFMEFVKKDIPPAAGPGDKKLVEKIVGDREKGLVTALDITAYPVVKEYVRLGEIRKALERQAQGTKVVEDGLLARILQLSGNAGEIETPWGVGFKATTVNVKPKFVDGYTFTKVTQRGEFKELENEPEETAYDAEVSDVAVP